MEVLPAQPPQKLHSRDSVVGPRIIHLCRTILGARPFFSADLFYQRLTEDPGTLCETAQAARALETAVNTAAMLGMSAVA